jgi:rRNA processing protein Gar1
MNPPSEAPQRAGELLHSTKTGRPVYRLQAEARINQPVLDAKGRRVGDVFDIFGPVTAPYASVRLREGVTEPPREIYLGERAERRPREKRRRQKR